jgi:hypothetical protein
MTTTHRICTAGMSCLLGLILMPGTIVAQQAAPPSPPPYPDPNQAPYPQQQPQQPQTPQQPYPQQYPPQPQPYPQQGYPQQYPPAQQPYPQQSYPQQYPPQQQPYPQPGYPQQYPPAGSYQAPPPAPPGHHGLLLMGFLGFHAFQGDTGEGLSPGLRLGGLLGFYASPVFSLNGELTLDFLNIDSSSPYNGATGVRALLALSPLYHVPAGNVELVIGPKFGGWGTTLSDDNSGASISARGYVLGLNAGVFARAGNINLGGLFSFEAGFPTSICFDDGLGDACHSATGSEKDADKIVAFNGAILF